MKKTIFIQDIASHVGKEISIKGWLYNKRSSGGLVFLHIRDGSGFVQSTVVKNEVTPKIFDQARDVMLESSLEIIGKVKSDPRSPGGFEVSVTQIKPIQLVTDEYPIGKKDHGPDFLLSHRHLWLRSKRQWAILRIRDTIIHELQEFYRQNEFTRIDTPIITPSACEGTTTLFELDYFGQKAYLSQSGQLYLEAAIASVGRCYDLSPVMRAEKSKTRRHLIEFWMTNAEAAFMTLDDILPFEEQLIKFILTAIVKSNTPELEILQRDISPIQNAIDKPFERITFRKAVDILHTLGSDITLDSDFGNDDETRLMNHFKVPLFVTHYPAGVKAFYCKRDPNDESLALSADLLAPEGYGEVIGGGEREDNYDILVKRIHEHNYDIADYEWYLDLRKFGSVPHSGFGLGIERILAWVCKLEHVRETIPFPRLLDRFRP